MIQLGQEVKHLTSGLEGIAVARYTFITASPQILVQPKVSETNTFINAAVMEEGELIVIGDGVIPQMMKRFER